MRRGGDSAFGQMSGSSRKRNSKWDLKEESRHSFENVEDAAWTEKPDPWLSPEDCDRHLKAMGSWDGDDGYRTRMSPGLDEWRQQKHHHSPKNDWKRSRRSRSHSRSRSRSPIHGFRGDSGALNRNRLSVSSLLCKDFTAGRCRRGNHCHFLHEGPEIYEESWEKRAKTAASKYSTPYDSREHSMGSGRPADICTDFLKGNCRRGTSCRFAHHSASSASSKGPVNEVIRERDNERRHRYVSPERRGERETRRAADVPCKFFAAGNCRNGKYCRFSHQGQANASPDIRSRDGRWSLGENSDDMEKPWHGPKWSDANISENAEKFSKDKNEKMDIPETSVAALSTDDRWGHHLEGNKSTSDPPGNHKVAASDKKEAFQWKPESTGNNENISEQRSSENWLGDMEMSPEWNCKVQPSNHIFKREHTSLPSLESSVTLEHSGRVHDTPVVMPPTLNETSSIQQDFNSREVGASALLNDYKGVTGVNAISHMNSAANMMAAQGFNQNGPSSLSKPDNENINATRESSSVPTSQNMVSGEQLAQLTNLSVSLAQFLATGQQLPHLLAAHNSHNGASAPFYNNSEGIVKPDSAMTVQQNQAVGPWGQCDPVCDSIESEKHDANNNPPGFPLTLLRQKSITDEKLELPSKKLSPSSLVSAPNGGDIHMDKSFELNQQEPGANSEVSRENNGVGTEGSKKVQEENKTVKENDPLETNGGNGKADESKKNKDGKGSRAFKFALVEFVKELLKPAWKEGSMSKDAYKNIVKKVVDKVTGTMQGSNIPQTQEKIEQYLSASKPKLTKLVQAYVEKFQKDK